MNSPTSPDAAASANRSWWDSDAADYHARHPSYLEGFHWCPEMLAEADEDTWDRIIATNLKGVFLCMKHEVRAMAPRGRGVIVNMSSLSGLLAEPGCYAYVASKHGILGLTKTAALDCAKLGIRINAVCPGAIETPGLMKSSEEFRRALMDKTPVGRLGRPEEVAAAVLWLCSDPAAYVTGTGLVMDGGVSIV